MRVTLEKEELLKILGKVFGYELTDKDVEIAVDPLEVHINKVDMDSLARHSNVSMSAVPSSPAETKEDSSEGYQEEVDNGVRLMEDVLAENAEIAAKGKKAFHSLGSNESFDPPPVTEEEMYNSLRPKIR